MVLLYPITGTNQAFTTVQQYSTVQYSRMRYTLFVFLVLESMHTGDSGQKQVSQAMSIFSPSPTVAWETACLRLLTRIIPTRLIAASSSSYKLMKCVLTSISILLNISVLKTHYDVQKSFTKVRPQNITFLCMSQPGLRVETPDNKCCNNRP